MSGIAQWYNNSYGNSISGTSRLRLSPFMPSGLRNSSAARSFMIGGGGAAMDEGHGGRFRAGPGGVPMTTAEMVAAAAAQQQQAGSQSQAGQAQKGRTKGEMLFGPDVGDETEAEKGWEGDRRGNEGAAAAVATTTTVPLGVVKGWVERAKGDEQPAVGDAHAHQTTTIQALVNVKRPTIQLVAVPSSARHAIKFSYDASAPQVRISVTLHDMDGSSVGSSATRSSSAPRVVHASLAPGGFARQWQLPESDALDLAALVDERRMALVASRKRAEAALRPSMESAADSDGDEKDLKRSVGAGGDSMTTVPQLSSAMQGLQTQEQQDPTARPRFGGILGRRQQRLADEEAQIGSVEMQPTSAADEAAPGDASQAQGPTTEATSDDAKREDESSVKVMITIEGCDDTGSPSLRNSQATHFLITSNAPSVTADIAASDAADTEPIRPSTEALRRIWTLRVVRREARIAGHTFLLREIYGLSSASNAEPTAPSQVTYPPKAEDEHGIEDPYASAPNECIVCLTSPRDVVLLPCRHLVVCRDCAVGMIEFGAGGKVARREDAEPATATGTGAEAPTGIPSVVGGANPPAPATRESERRRRKKAKGWFCPVCRQPYTSLLRLALPKPDEAVAAHSTHTLSRQPSIAGASMRSLRRTPSRATLPERGERMLTELQPDEADEPTMAIERPQFVIEDEASPAGVTVRDMAAAPRASTESKSGWRQVEA